MGEIVIGYKILFGRVASIDETFELLDFSGVFWVFLFYYVSNRFFPVADIILNKKVWNANSISDSSVCWVKFLKPDWYLYRTLLSDRKFIVWSWIMRSIILEISGSSEMGLKFFESVLRPFLYKGLIFATLTLSGKEPSLMERL